MEALKEKGRSQENSWTLGNVARQRGRLWGGWPWRSESGEVVTSKVHTMPEQWKEVRNWNNTVEILELLGEEESEEEAAARLLQLRRQKRRAPAERLVMGEIRERV